MKKIKLIILSITMVSTLSFAQTPPEKKERWIKIQVFQQSKGGKLGAVKEILYYDLEGNIRLISGGVLNPVATSEQYQYAAEFQYNPAKDLIRENLFEIDGEEIRLKRYTTYRYEEDCVDVEVRTGTTQELIGAFQNCHFPSEHKVIKTIDFDKILQVRAPRWVNTQVTWKYNPDGRPSTLEILDEQHALEYQYQFHHFWNSSHINTTIYRGGKMISEGNEKRNYDDGGRLVAIKYGEPEAKTGIEIKYRKSGFLKEIKHNGMMVPPGGTLYNPGTYSWNKLIFRIIVPPRISQPAMEQINTEILRMYLPLSGRLMNLNFDDSRRYLQHRG